MVDAVKEEDHSSACARWLAGRPAALIGLFIFWISLGLGSYGLVELLRLAFGGLEPHSEPKEKQPMQAHRRTTRLGIHQSVLLRKKREDRNEPVVRHAPRCYTTRRE